MFLTMIPTKEDEDFLSPANETETNATAAPASLLRGSALSGPNAFAKSLLLTTLFIAPLVINDLHDELTNSLILAQAEGTPRWGHFPT